MCGKIMDSQRANSQRRVVPAMGMVTANKQTLREDGRSQCAHNQGDPMVCPPLPPTMGTMMPTLPTVPTLPTPTRAIYVGHEFRSPCDLCNALPARTSESHRSRSRPQSKVFKKHPDPSNIFFLLGNNLLKDSVFKCFVSVSIKRPAGQYFDG